MLGLPLHGNVLGIRLGANYVSDDRLSGLYSGFGSIAAGIARVGAELSGLVILADSYPSYRDRDFGERTTFLLTLKAEFPATFAQPEFYARAPLDDDSNQIVDFVLGAKVRLAVDDPSVVQTTFDWRGFWRPLRCRLPDASVVDFASSVLAVP